MDSELTTFLKNNILSSASDTRLNLRVRDETDHFVLLPSGELIEIRCSIIRRKLKLAQDSIRGKQSTKILHFKSYYPILKHCLIKLGDTVYIVERGSHFKVINKIEHVIYLDIADLCYLGRPLVSLKLRGHRGHELLDINHGLQYFDNSAICQNDCTESIQVHINEADKYLMKKVRTTQKLIMYLKGFYLSFFTISEVELLESLMCDFKYWSLRKPFKRNIRHLALGELWSLTLESKLVIGIPVKNLGWESIKDVEFHLFCPLANYSAILITEKISDVCVSYSVSNYLLPFSKGVIVILLEIEELENTYFSFSGIILHNKFQVQNMLPVDVNLLEIMKRDSSMCLEKEIVMSLIATAKYKEFILDFPNNCSDVTIILLNIGFNKSVNGYYLFPTDFPHVLRSAIVKVFKCPGVQGSIRLALHCRDIQQCCVLVHILKKVLGKEGFELSSHEKELQQISISCLTQELKCLHSHIIEGMPILAEFEYTDERNSCMDVNNYLNLLEFEKNTDIALMNYMNFNLAF